MTAGRRRFLVSFSRLGGGQDESGQEVDNNWAETGKEWADVLYGSGQERREAAMEQGSQAAVFRVPDNDFTRSVKTKDRITHDGADWDITGIVPFETKGEREFTGVRTS
jgi:SPP1 family predicted phage head-tail adaptor